MRDKKRKAAVTAVIIILMIPLVYAVSGFYLPYFQKDSGEYQKRGKEKIALITKSTTSSFWKSVYDGAKAASTEYNLELVFWGPNSEEDYVTQNQMVEKAVAEGMNAIIFSAVDYEENAHAIDEASKQGVKIISIDSSVNSQNVEYYIGTDNYKAGEMAGERALQNTSENLHIGIVNFDENTENGQQRECGFRETVKKDSRVVIEEAINVQSSTSAAKKATKEMLSHHPEINIIVTFNEWTSLGVGYAIRELELENETDVIAFDNNVVSVGMLETGEVDALIVQNPYAIGYLGVEKAYQVLNNKKPDTKLFTTESFLVTRENMYQEEYQRILFEFDK